MIADRVLSMNYEHSLGFLLEALKPGNQPFLIRMAADTGQLHNLGPDLNLLAG